MTTSTIDAICVDPTCPQRFDVWGQPRKAFEHNAHGGLAAMETTPDTVEAAWKPNRYSFSESVDKTVDLTGAPQITAKGGPCRPVTIIFHFVRFKPGGEWTAQITIYASQQYRHDRIFFKPADVHQVPQWLTELIANATPEV